LSATLVARLAAAAGDESAGLQFFDRRERLTATGYAEVAAAAKAIGGKLQALGVAAGERVALVYPTCREFVDALFGILYAGAVPVPLYPPVRLGRLDEYHRRTAAMLNAAGAVLALADTRLRPLLGPTVEQAKMRHGCLTLGELPAGDPNAPPVERSGEDLGLVQFSSGTTAMPKPVALSNRAILAQVDLINGSWAPSGMPRPTGFSWLPLYHDMGLIGCLFAALSLPGELTLMGPEVFVARPAAWLRGMSLTKASVSVAPNFAYGLCLEKIRDEELEGVDLSAWQVALCGAEPVSPAVLRAFARRFAKWGFREEALTPVYGLSEATLAVSFSPLGKAFASRTYDRERLARGEAVPADGEKGTGIELASLGKALPGTRMRIVAEPGGGEKGEPLPERVVGRLEVSGPSLMEGYLGRPEATAEVLQEGWLDTGDLGFLDQDELYLTGRAKDVIVLRGRKYAPADIEQALDNVPGVRKGCSVAASGQVERGDRELLYVFVEWSRAAQENLEAKVREAILEATGLLADQVVPVDPGTLPRTSSGKLRRGETLRLHLEGELAPPRKVTPWLLAGAWVKSRLAFRRAKKAAAGR
jgi:fatty-acyl-CoA synthase